MQSLCSSDKCDGIWEIKLGGLEIQGHPQQQSKPEINVDYMIVWLKIETKESCHGT